jgi:hypothetical protein
MSHCQKHLPKISLGPVKYYSIPTIVKYMQSSLPQDMCSVRERVFVDPTRLPFTANYTRAADALPATISL